MRAARERRPRWPPRSRRDAAPKETPIWSPSSSPARHDGRGQRVDSSDATDVFRLAQADGRRRPGIPEDTCVAAWRFRHVCHPAAVAARVLAWDTHPTRTLSCGRSLGREDHVIYYRRPVKSTAPWSPQVLVLGPSRELAVRIHPSVFD